MQFSQHRHQDLLHQDNQHPKEDRHFGPLNKLLKKKEFLMETVNLFKLNSVRLACDFPELTDLMNLRADFSFSTI